MWKNNLLIPKISCPRCQERFIEIVKFILDCGPSMWGKCNPDLMNEIMVGSDKFKCKECYKSASTTNDGLPTEMKLHQILKAKYLYEQMNSLITWIEIILGYREDKYDHDLARTKVNLHCDYLEDKINANFEKCVDHLKTLENDSVAKINLFRRQLNCLKNGTPFVIDEAEKAIIVDPILKISEKENGWVRMVFNPNRLFYQSAAHIGKLFYFSSNVYDQIQESLSTLRIESKKKVLLVMIPGNEQCACCLKDGIIEICRPENGYLLFELSGHTSQVCCIIGLNNGFLASGSQDQTIIIWDLKEKKLIDRLIGHNQAVLSLLELPNGNLASCSKDKTIKIWNLRESSLIHSIIISHSSIASFSELGLLSNGNLIHISLHQSYPRKVSALRVFDPLVGKCVKSFPTSWEHMPSFAVLDDDLIALGLESGEIQIFDMNSENLNVPLKVIESCDNARVTGLSRTSCGHLISSTFKCFTYSSINIYDKNGDLTKTIFTKHADVIDSITVSRDESKIFTTFYDNTVKVWTLNL